MYTWVAFQLKCKCFHYLLGLALRMDSGNPNEGAKVTGMTNKKSKWIVGQMCRFGLDFNSATSVWLIVLALHQVMAVETLIRVQR